MGTLITTDEIELLIVGNYPDQRDYWLNRQVSAQPHAHHPADPVPEVSLSISRHRREEGRATWTSGTGMPALPGD